MNSTKVNSNQNNKISTTNKTVKHNLFWIRLITLISIPIVAFATYNVYFINRVYPNIFIAGLNVEGLKAEEVTALLSDNIKKPEIIKLVSSNYSYEINTKDIDLQYDISASTLRALNFVRTGNYIHDLYKRILILGEPKHFGIISNHNEEKLEDIISLVAKNTSSLPVYPSVGFVNSKIVVNKGKAGSDINKVLLRNKIGENISFAKNEDIQIPIEQIDPTLTEAETATLEERAKKYIGKKLIINFEYDSFTFSEKENLSFVSPRGGYTDEEINKQLFKIAEKVNRPAQEPKFDFQNGKVQEFLPAKDGIEVDIEKASEIIKTNLGLIETSTDTNISFDLPVNKTSPLVTTDKVNNLGIKELIGRGTSTYFHSIPGRVHNVALATSRVNGTLIKPGETFSFNQTVGDISKLTGYQTAYIIQDGKTVLGDGGGVCQVSTTLFRAALDAGLPIDERRAHSYRVSYYEQNSSPGIDATVFSPTTDFKFTNDTKNYILITAKADTKNYSLVFELYGTKDGREAIITKPVVSSVTAPPPDLYQDDPTLPSGTIKQVDFKASGAKVSFNYSVKRGDEEIYNKTFVSNYRPWQAIYLRGTKTN